jgi:LSD1 subclass zinc finger protein
LSATELQPADADTAFVRVFPCTGCGAKLSYAPGTKVLRCEFCGTKNDIVESDARVEELDFATWVKALEGKQEVVEEEHVKCAKCGAEQNLPGSLFAGKCTFCGADIVSKSYANRRIKPRSIAPFQLDRPKAQDSFRHWLRWRWLAPNDLRRYAQTDAVLTGIYLPFWTYDCRTSSDYRGDRGEKRNKQTDWTPVSGHVDMFHDDVVVLASRSLPASLQGAIARWDTKALVPYQPDFVSGFQAEAYQIGLADSYPLAKKMIDERIRRAVRRDIGGDDQRIDSINTGYSDVTFKHTLLPVWISAYRYRDKVYRFLVNGQTGEACGESPVSWWKVAILVAIGLFFFWLWVKSQ